MHLAFAVLLFLQAGSSMPTGNVVQPGAPGQPSKTLARDAHAVRPPLSPADVAFMQGMIMHHAQAVEMTALINSRTDNKALRDFGRRISLSQTDEIKFMQQWLEARGEPTTMKMDMSKDMNMTGAHAMAMPMMPGMLTLAQMAALRAAHGKEFDRLFLTGMIQHHGGALTMVRELFNSGDAGQSGELFDFATDVDNTQRAEIVLMEKLLKENQ
jgi:uncharacterized protein (DUF305 family)